MKSLSYLIKEASYEVKAKRKINNKTKNSCVSLIFGNYSGIYLMFVNHSR